MRRQEEDLQVADLRQASPDQGDQQAGDQARHQAKVHITKHWGKGLKLLGLE